MSNEPALEEFEQRARQALRASADTLDGSTRSRLTQARHAALSAGGRSAWLDLRRLAPAGAAAVVVLATVLYVGRGGVEPATRDSTLHDLEMLADSDAFDLSQEDDYEFIEWAAAMNGARAGS